jgi:iron(III) transport system ATP-binding protein
VSGVSAAEGPAGTVGAPPASEASPQSHAITIRSLTKTFGKRGSGEQALRAVDLDVRTGEFLVLLGPSGCGKTTLLRSIAGLERPDEGSIWIDGQVAFDSAARVDVDAGRRPVTMIFQSYALWPHMSAAKNVAFPLRCAGVSRSEIASRVDEILTKVGIGQLAARYPGEMSGGQQQRLALARALVVGQRVVLFDEPLSNVDAQVREKLRLELIRMQRTLGFTAIYVTHDQSEAMELADRIAVMSQGRVAQLDEPRELYKNPRDINVARFLGQSNELPLVVEEYDPQTDRIVGRGPVGRVAAVWQPGAETAPPRVGEELVAFGRPADFVVAEPRDASGGAEAAGDQLHDNRWRGKVEATRFLGSHTEYVVQIGESRLRCWAAAEGHEEVEEHDDVSVLIGARKLQAIRES